ncbi:MAG: hypothetical protein AAGC64_04585 [Bacteroidota bacterium]
MDSNSLKETDNQINKKIKEDVISVLRIFENFYYFLCANHLDRKKGNSFYLEKEVIEKFKKFREYNKPFKKAIIVSQELIRADKYMWSVKASGEINATEFMTPAFFYYEEYTGIFRKLIEWVILHNLDFISEELNYIRQNLSKIVNSTQYSTVLWLCNMLTYLEKRLEREISIMEYHEAYERDCEFGNVIDAFKDNALEEILNNHRKGAEKVVINSVVPLLEKVAFLKLIVSNKIDFFSIKEPEISSKLSLSLNEFANEKGIRVGGNPKGGDNIRRIANEFAKKMGPVFDKLEKEGIATYQGKADELNSKGIKTLRGNDWKKTTVVRTLERWQKIKVGEEKKNSSNPQSSSLKP